MKTFMTLAAALFSAALAAPAAAAIKVATYTGTVDAGAAGVDGAGVFGAVGAEHAGETMVSTFVYDTSLGIRTTTASSDSVYGGAHYGVSDPLLSATVTVGGATLNIDSSTYYGSAGVSTATTPDVFYGAIGEQAEAFYDNGITSLVIFAQTLEDTLQPNPNTLDASFVDPGPYVYQGLEFITVNDATGDREFEDFIQADTGTVVVSDYLSPTGPVPEPSTWALMLLGFGGVGAVARSRRRLPSPVL